MEVTLLKGSDPVTLEGAALEAVRSAVGDAERAEVLEEFRGDDYSLGEVCLAAQTISMFGERVVVARNLARFSAKEVGPLVDLLGDHSAEFRLVLVWDRPSTSGARANAVPKKLADAVKAAGGQVVDTAPPGGRARHGWLADRFDRADVSLDPAARALVEDYLGDEVGRLPALLEVIAASNPGRTNLGEDDIRPLLGESGGVPPWDLTDAIDRGETARAVELARRMMAGGARHPLQVMASLQSHYERMFRLDGSGARDEKAAASILGLKGSTFPAKKALAQASRLGHQRLTRAIRLLARADVELRGATANPPEAVMELLVARLAALGRSDARRAAGRPR